MRRTGLSASAELLVFIVRQHVMHTKRDIVLLILSVRLSLCLSVSLSNVGIVSKGHIVTLFLTFW